MKVQRSKRTYAQYAARLNNAIHWNPSDEKLPLRTSHRSTLYLLFSWLGVVDTVFVDMTSGAHTSNYVSALVIFVVLGTVYLAAHLC